MRDLRALLLVTVAMFAVLGGSAAVGGQEAATATISGTAYTFNTRNVIAGATIRAVEHPDVSTTTAADGSYTLTFPVGAEVTLYIEAAGHSSIHIQTFTLDEAHEGTEVVGANFQTPTTGIYDALRALVGSYIGGDPFEGGCVIVTTVGMQELAGMPFEEFIQFAPHGVAGATAAIDPPTAQPIYFNESVVPDLAQLTTSNDGGVLWAKVPPGTYTLSADHPTVDFTTAEVRCEAGWVVNANPVWGLHAVAATTTTTTTSPPTTATPVPTTTTRPDGAPTSSTPTTTTTPASATTDGAESTTSTSHVPAGPSTPSTPAGNVGGTGAQPSRGGALSRTGTDSPKTAGAAVALVVGGALLLVVSRRRRPAHL